MNTSELYEYKRNICFYNIIASPERARQSVVAREAWQSHTINCACEERSDAAISTFSQGDASSLTGWQWQVKESSSLLAMTVE
jgi:hypothetical protein